MSAEPGFSIDVRAAVHVGRFIVSSYARFMFDLQVDNRERLPAGAMVLAGNHNSYLDPPLGYLATNRPVRYMAVDEIYGTVPAFDRFLEYYGTIPMSRVRAPLGALRAALEHLDVGGIVALFPEGKLTATWGEATPKRGAAWLAMLSGAPLMPMGTVGAGEAYGPDDKRPKRSPIRMRLGYPIWPDDYLDHVDPIGAMTAQWECAVGELLEPRYRSVVP